MQWTPLIQILQARAAGRSCHTTRAAVEPPNSYSTSWPFSPANPTSYAGWFTAWLLNLVLLRGGRTFFVVINYRIFHQCDLNPVSGNTKILSEPCFLFCASVPTKRANRCKTSNIVNSMVFRSYLLYFFFSVLLCFPCFLQGKVQSTKLMQKLGILFTASGLRPR